MKTDIPFGRTITEHRQRVSTVTPLLGPANVPCQDFPNMTIYKPNTPVEGGLPTILYIPGNAFVASETGYTHFICSHIAEQSRCQVIVIKHPLAPEFQFPHGLNTAYKTLKLLLDPENPWALKIDKTRVAIAGYSSGGNFAALMTIQAKLQNIPIARQILISPITDLSRSLKGFETLEQQDTAISEQFVEWFLNLYVPKNIPLRDPGLSPYWTENTQLKGLPTTDIIFGELDRFRSDSELYAHQLSAQGNQVYTLMFKQENHGLLWHNIQVINMISARLALSFGTEPVDRAPSDRDVPIISILYLKNTPERKEIPDNPKAASRLKY